MQKAVILNICYNQLVLFGATQPQQQQQPQLFAGLLNKRIMPLVYSRSFLRDSVSTKE